jgi:hypothetical protein
MIDRISDHIDTFLTHRAQLIMSIDQNEKEVWIRNPLI